MVLIGLKSGIRGWLMKIGIRVRFFKLNCGILNGFVFNR